MVPTYSKGAGLEYIAIMVPYSTSHSEILTPINNTRSSTYILAPATQHIKTLASGRALCLLNWMKLMLCQQEKEANVWKLLPQTASTMTAPDSL